MIICNVIKNGLKFVQANEEYFTTLGLIDGKE